MSVGSIYQYFPHKEALFTAVARRMVARMEALLASHLPALVSEEAGGAIQGFISAIVALQRADPMLHSRVRRLGLPEVDAVLEAFEARTEGMIAGVLVSRLQLGQDPILVAKVLVRSVVGLIQQSLHRDPEALHDPRLEAELILLVSGYLLPKARTTQEQPR